MKAPTTIQTKRLLLRKPEIDDAEDIFKRYAADPRIGRYIAWPIHKSVEDTIAFLEFSDSAWERDPAGPYLIFSGEGLLVGSTGLDFAEETMVTTGYVLAVDAWGRGIATEATVAMRDLAKQLGVRRFGAFCHPEHTASARVLQKCGLDFDGTLSKHCEFPNLAPGVLQDVVAYSCTWKA